MPDQPLERAYPYRPRWKAIILPALLFSGVGTIIGLRAATNEEGLRLSGIIELSAPSASILLWVLCGLSGLFVVGALALGAIRLTVSQQLVVFGSSLSVPRSRWSSESQSIRLHEIQKIELLRVHGQRFAKVYHNGGKITITATMLPTDADFEEIVRVLEDRQE